MIFALFCNTIWIHRHPWHTHLCISVCMRGWGVSPTGSELWNVEYTLLWSKLWLLSNTACLPLFRSPPPLAPAIWWEVALAPFRFGEAPKKCPHQLYSTYSTVWVLSLLLSIMGSYPRCQHWGYNPAKYVSPQKHVPPSHYKAALVWWQRWNLRWCCMLLQLVWFIQKIISLQLVQASFSLVL